MLKEQMEEVLSNKKITGGITQPRLLKLIGDNFV